MNQIIFGFLSENTVPWLSTFPHKTTIGYRIRQYPTHRHYLLYVGEDLAISPNWDLLASTSGGRIDWHTLDNQWRWYAGYEGEGRDYFSTWQNEEIWKIGGAITAYTGIRYKLSTPFFVSFTTGYQREYLDFKDSSNTNAHSYETRFNPWVKVGLETWVEKPSANTI